MIRYFKHDTTPAGTYSIDYFTFDFLLLCTEAQLQFTFISVIERYSSSCPEFQHFTSNKFGYPKEIYQFPSVHRIVENLKWCPFWEWTLTFIPKYAGKFDSSITPELEPMPYKEVEGELPPTLKQRVKSLFRKPVDALHQLKRNREEVEDEEADDFPYEALSEVMHEDAPSDNSDFGW